MNGISKIVFSDLFNSADFAHLDLGSSSHPSLYPLRLCRLDKQCISIFQSLFYVV